MLFRIVAFLFALTAILSLVAAYEAHQEGKSMRMYIVRGVLWASFCIVFVSVGRIKRRAIQADEDASSKHPNDRNG